MRRFLLALALILFGGTAWAQVHPTPPTTDVPWAINGNLTGAITTTGARMTAGTQSGVSADQIVGWVFCTSSCLPLPAQGAGNYDGLRGIGISNSGTTTPIVAGVSGYVLANQAFSGAGPFSVALFGTGAINVDGGRIEGMNVNVSDREFRVAQAPGTHNRLINGAEIDVSASYFDTSVTGLLIAGNSVLQPTSSTAISIVGQDFSASTPGSIARWGQAIFTLDNVATHFALIGTATASSTANSQDILMGARISSVAYQEQLYFGTNSFGNSVSPALNTNYPLAIATGGLVARSAVDQLIQLGGHNTLSSGASIESRNDANSLVEPLEILATDILLNSNVLHVNNGGSGVTIAANCSGTPSSSFAAVNGIVTHC
jgi:hypothetical protein